MNLNAFFIVFICIQLFQKGISAKIKKHICFAKSILRVLQAVLFSLHGLCI